MLQSTWLELDQVRYVTINTWLELDQVRYVTINMA